MREIQYIAILSIALAACAGPRRASPPERPIRDVVVIGESRPLPVPPKPTPPPRSLPASFVEEDKMDPAPDLAHPKEPPVNPLPEAQRIPGKPGMVASPFGGTGLIDVTGMPPGSLARDPYTGKIFLIPL